MSLKVKHTKIWVLFIVGAAALLLTACFGGGPETTYKCYGNASGLLVEYTGEDGVMVEESVSLPWTQSVVIGGNELNIVLSATNEGDAGDFTCEIIVDDHSVMTAEGAGGLEISGDYSKSGNTAEANFSSAYIPHEEPVAEAVEEEPAEEEAAAEEAPAPDPATGLQIINGLDAPICAVYLVESGAPDWGESRLTEADDFILLPDTDFIIPDMETKSYDILVEACTGDIVSLLTRTELGPNMWVEISTYETDRKITVQNNSSVDVCEFSLGTNEDNRTRNLIIDKPLAAGDEKEIVINAGVLTLWAKTCDGTDLQVNNVDLMEHDGYVLDITDDLLASGGEGGTADIEFINDTSVDICGLYMLEDASKGWGGNYLTDPIGSGGNHTLNGVPQIELSYKVESCNGIILGWAYDIDFAQVVEEIGTTDLTLTISEKALMKIDNTSSLDICGLYIRATGDSNIYPDVLSEDVTLGSGQQVGLNIPPGTYDFVVESCTGETQDLLAENIYDGYVWEISD
ncbi:MAG: hypothetical protein JXJ17_19660 [Anaerolineae bacterium]|nr:hypothetical protein [Anaerolineae bacterium]